MVDVQRVEHRDVIGPRQHRLSQVFQRVDDQILNGTVPPRLCKYGYSSNSNTFISNEFEKKDKSNLSSKYKERK